MTNEQLVARIQAGEDTGNSMALLYDQVKDFIRSVAWQYRDTGELEDLLQEGYLALYPAIDNYDPAGFTSVCGVICRTTAAVCVSRCSAWNRFGR